MVCNYWESKLVAKRGHLKYLDELRELSRKGRRKMTKTENIFWYEVLRGRKTGYKFLRQKPIHRFILDFYCRELLMAIEIDGDYHHYRRNIDKERDKFLRSLNIVTLRIDSKDVIDSLDKVKREVKRVY